MASAAPLRPLLPSPVRARSRHLGQEGGEGPGHPARRWLPKDALHFSAIYRVYPQPLRTALASLNDLGGVSGLRGGESRGGEALLPELGVWEGSGATARFLGGQFLHR